MCVYERERGFQRDKDLERGQGDYLRSPIKFKKKETKTQLWTRTRQFWRIIGRLTLWNLATDKWCEGDTTTQIIGTSTQPRHHHVDPSYFYLYLLSDLFDVCPSHRSNKQVSNHCPKHIPSFIPHGSTVQHMNQLTISFHISLHGLVSPIQQVHRMEGPLLPMLQGEP